MKTLIIYSSKYGTTEKCSNVLKDKLEGEVAAINIKKDSIPEIDSFDTIIIGSSVYMGKISKKINEFVVKNLGQLKGKKVALFLCCMAEGADGEKQINTVYPQELVDNAIDKELLGGEFLFSKMNFFEKFIIKKISKSDGEKDVSKVSEDKINSFAKIINAAK